MLSEPPKSRDELLSRYAAGERVFTGMELDYIPDSGVIDLSNTILDNADFSQCWFISSFRGSSLRHSKFVNSNVKTCDFSFADLTGADFSGAAMEATIWNGATLFQTRFGEVNLYGDVLSESRFLDLMKLGGL